LILTRERRYKILQVLGDGKPHNWFEVIFLGVQFLKIHQRDFENLLQQCVVDNALIYRTGKALTIKDDSLALTKKGDSCLRDEQIARDGDYNYYKTFDRSIEDVDRFAPLPKHLKK